MAVIPKVLPTKFYIVKYYPSLLKVNNSTKAPNDKKKKKNQESSSIFTSEKHFGNIIVKKSICSIKQIRLLFSYLNETLIFLEKDPPWF